jgi:hypothetical protein
MIMLSVIAAIEYKESLKKLEEGTETMENHLLLKAAKDKEADEWRKLGKTWD